VGLVVSFAGGAICAPAAAVGGDGGGEVTSGVALPASVRLPVAGSAPLLIGLGFRMSMG
jgi:hypothetical protein